MNVHVASMLLGHAAQIFFFIGNIVISAFTTMFPQRLYYLVIPPPKKIVSYLHAYLLPWINIITSEFKSNAYGFGK